MQIEHHLFPSVNHCHLPQLVPEVKRLCLKYDIHYPEAPSMWEALKKHTEHLYQMGAVAYENEQNKQNIKVKCQ